MILYKKKTDLQDYLLLQKRNSRRTGFVPTMGALHDGHLSLIERSRRDNSKTICSIFINPTQFNDPGDFEKYPITIEQDIYRLESAGCDVLFLPSVNEIYPDKVASLSKADKFYNLGHLETILEGKFRPGHFQGVCMVMNRLLDIVRADNLYLGQKDYQQCMVIARLIELMGLRDSIKVNICPTLREVDGLAMSSRNLRLNKEERKKAPSIYQSLQYIKKNLQKGNLESLRAKAVAYLEANGFKVDYVEIADAASLQIINEWNGKTNLVALAAAFLNEVRLIDNLLLNE
ncbi:MAG TPA: pantoate--beta-alanine ligase [Chitinophagaceae bacterium]|nr:pantoate--beta-alanine ligase [Chitinophagaceae bacterium]